MTSSKYLIYSLVFLCYLSRICSYVICTFLISIAFLILSMSFLSCLACLISFSFSSSVNGSGLSGITGVSDGELDESFCSSGLSSVIVGEGIPDGSLETLGLSNGYGDNGFGVSSFASLIGIGFPFASRPGNLDDGFVSDVGVTYSGSSDAGAIGTGGAGAGVAGAGGAGAGDVGAEVTGAGGAGAGATGGGAYLIGFGVAGAVPSFNMRLPFLSNPGNMTGSLSANSSSLSFSIGFYFLTSYFYLIS